MPRSVRRSTLIGSARPGGRSVIRPLCSSEGGSSFISASAVVVLPQPDSPASPSASPGSSVMSTPSTIGAAGRRHPQVLDLEQGPPLLFARAHACASRSRGLMYSSNR